MNESTGLASEKVRQQVKSRVSASSRGDTDLGECCDFRLRKPVATADGTQTSSPAEFSGGSAWGRPRPRRQACLRSSPHLPRWVSLRKTPSAKLPFFLFHLIVSVGIPYVSLRRLSTRA
ncbi:hypothetical protein AVEN_85490-1 [Araneus ventricosus]|uniref:Uncharacterized protein n=1 Tax=Araneus ventricosus TaxID=182803 RepID=A0A4Y2HZQ4_ARAVE|nr:hypothetical protein AVEN_85490-1 [Araneus ventricosus]